MYYECSTFILCNMYFPSIEVYVRNVLIVSTKQLLVFSTRQRGQFHENVTGKRNLIAKNKG